MAEHFFIDFHSLNLNLKVKGRGTSKAFPLDKELYCHYQAQGGFVRSAQISPLSTAFFGLIMTLEGRLSSLKVKSKIDLSRTANHCRSNLFKG